MKVQFGAKITKNEVEKFKQSPNWKKDKFENLVETTMAINLKTLPKIIYKQFFEKKNRAPKEELPIIPLDITSFLSTTNQAKFIWYGHSVILMRMNHKTILIDPMFGNNAAPISPFPIKRFSSNTLHLIDTFPPIDLVLLSHDHYDHLDYESIQKLLPKVKKYYVALGVSRHLEKWGVDKKDITEFDWWDEIIDTNLKITFTPTRHFSGRGLTDRAKSLWGGWTLKSNNENIWFSGDSGYGDHFHEIGRRLGPFDFAFMECGQYNVNWHQIHMYPEESVQASIDAKVKNCMPVHWAGFALAQHTWTDPVERFRQKAIQENRLFCLPKIGAISTIETNTTAKWWQ